MYHLERISETWREELAEYKRELYEASETCVGAFLLDRYEDLSTYVSDVQGMEADESLLPEGLVPSTQFLCIRESDQKLCGLLSIRHRLNEYLEQFGGHIGYSVRPSERRKGIATQMLAAALPEAYALSLDRVLITCNEQNIASERVIRACGGEFDRLVYNETNSQNVKRFWVDCRPR